jgi:hypothetical protein
VRVTLTLNAGPEGNSVTLKGEYGISELHDKLISSFADVCHETSDCQKAMVGNKERRQIFQISDIKHFAEENGNAFQRTGRTDHEKKMT